MQRQVLFIGGTGLFLAACAAYQMPPVNTNHPASAEAVSAPRAQRSQTLAYTPADVPSRTPVRDTAVAQDAADGPSQPRGGAVKTVTGEGKVIATIPDSDQLVVDHGEIKGFMGAMTMGYPVEPPSQLVGLAPGDRVRFEIDVDKKAIVKIEKLR
jgi:Cu/Ag efflux protein CusF